MMTGVVWFAGYIVWHTIAMVHWEALQYCEQIETAPRVVTQRRHPTGARLPARVEVDPFWLRQCAEQVSRLRLEGGR